MNDREKRNVTTYVFLCDTVDKTRYYGTSIDILDSVSEAEQRRNLEAAEKLARYCLQMTKEDGAPIDLSSFRCMSLPEYKKWAKENSDKLCDYNF